MRLPLPALVPLALAAPLAAAHPQTTAEATAGPTVLHPGGSFGSALAVDGPWLAVGADESGMSHVRGAVQVYRRDGAGWRIHQSLLPPVPQPSAFGSCVSIAGDWMAVGAPAPSGVGGVRVHLFELVDGAWSAGPTLVLPGGSSSSEYGAAVALSGSTLAVGAPGAGIVEVHERTGGTWTRVASLSSPDGAAVDRFGEAVAVDGDELVVGAPRAVAGGVDRVGAAYLYAWNGSAYAWTERFDAIVPEQGMRFGGGVAIEGDRVLVGAPGHDGDRGQLLTFDRAGGSFGRPDLAPVTGPRRHIGGSIDLDGDRLLLGSPSLMNPIVRAYERQGSAWVETSRVEPTGSGAQMALGESVAWFGDEILAGAGDAYPGTGAGDPRAGAVFRWVAGPTGHGPALELSKYDGRPDAEYGGGMRVNSPLVGAPGHDLAGPDTGAVYFSSSLLRTNKMIAPDPVAGARFGEVTLQHWHDFEFWSVVTAPGFGGGTGKAYVYGSASPGFALEQTLEPGAPGVGFGAAAAALGPFLFLSAPRDSTAGFEAGAVYVYRAVDGRWEYRATLVASDAVFGDHFGETLSAANGRLFVGAPAALGHAGAAYVFEQVGGSWTEIQKIRPAGASVGQSFGASLAASDETLVIGAPGEAGGTGAEYFYDTVPGSFQERMRFVDPLAIPGDRVGASVAMHERAAGIGTPGRDEVTLFHRTGVTWLPVETISPPAALAGLDFGGSHMQVSYTFSTALPTASDGLGGDGVDLRAPLPFLPPFHETFCQTNDPALDCPCGNDAPHGCGNSNTSFLTSCWLTLDPGQESDSISADDQRFVAIGMPLNSFALLFSGTERPTPTALGDGLLCVGGTLLRHGVEPTTPTYGVGRADFGPGIASAAGFVAGETRHFQVWYRDVGGPCGSGFNTSSALSITFGP